ncbi:MAG: sigma 54-interacting transcriptional regulator, partial [Nitrospinae bacterium]|nr:sigma 54-interacting transcriptional regulator [Nitrospinota bacterium]
NRALKYKALFDEKERYRTNLEVIFRSVKDAIITVDEGLSIIEINEAAETICGLSRKDVIGKRFGSRTTHCNGKCLDAVKETIRTKEPVEVSRFWCQYKERTAQVVTLTAYPLKDIFSGAILIVKDETRLAVLESALKERRQLHNIIGMSEKMQKLYSLIESLCDVQTTVLITGESGTGKEMVAEALHYMGGRSSKPLVKVSCSVLSEELLESELFGHVKGAFTGAVKERIGRFQMADGGTIFLDEIGDISPKIQIKLLRVLQEMEFECVGDSTPVKVDVRVVAATNQDLKEKVRSGKFREDLYYRLKVIELNIPPLRNRREDIPLLTNHFIAKFNKKIKKNITGISADVEKLFMKYPWHGNIRELEHTIEHAFILCRQSAITVDHLPQELKEFTPHINSYVRDEGDEYQTILQALEKTGWNKAKTARLLGMNRRTIYRKIEKYKIQTPHLPPPQPAI